MNFDILYSIAIDLINKKRANNINISQNDFACVILTENDKIFTGMNTSDIQDGKLITHCAEYQTIKNMMSSNETKIKALINVNAITLAPTIPCENCQKLILEINQLNSNALILLPDKSFKSLKDIQASNTNDEWDIGWDDDDELPQNRNSVQSNDYQFHINPNYSDNPMATNPINSNLGNGSSMYTSMYVNPMPNQPVNNANMYGSKYLNPISSQAMSRSMYGNSIYNNQVRGSVYGNVGSNSKYQAMSRAYQSTLQVTPVQNAGSILNQPQAQETNLNSVFKSKLNNIFTGDDDDNTENIPENTNSKSVKPTMSKKELLKLAKERKKQAKKNNKILEAMEKQHK